MECIDNVPASCYPHGMILPTCVQMQDYQHVSDFMILVSFWMDFSCVFEWYRNYENPIGIDDYVFDIDCKQQ